MRTASLLTISRSILCVCGAGGRVCPTPPGGRPPWMQISLVMWPVMPAGKPTPHCGQKEWQMPVKTLPCPKLRFWSSKNSFSFKFRGKYEHRSLFLSVILFSKEIYTASVVEVSFVLESHAAITKCPAIQQMSCKFDIVEMGSCWNTNSPITIHRGRVMLHKPIINTCYLHIYLRATTLMATSSSCIEWHVWQSVASFNIKW